MSLKYRAPRSLLVAAWLFAAGAAHAQYHIPVYTGTPLMISAGVVTQQTLNRQIDMTSRRQQPAPKEAARPAPAGGAEAALLVGSAPAGMPARLAAQLPPSVRADAQTLYGQILDKYPQLARQLGVPANDVAGAVAMFIVGSYTAFRNVEVPGEHFQPLYRQVRQAIAGEAAFAGASAAQRRELFEQAAILGTFLVLVREGLKQRHDARVAASVKAAGKDYLQQFLKVDPERLQLTQQGLTMS